jgi:predicted nuclease with TOPRIM domain
LVETPLNVARWKLSGGHDPSDLQLKTKLTFIEQSLSKREDEALEKDCLVDEISELAEDVRRKAAQNLRENKESFDQLSEYQYNIQTTTNRMMALVSELSLTQVKSRKAATISACLLITQYFDILLSPSSSWHHHPLMNGYPMLVINVQLLSALF